MVVYVNFCKDIFMFEAAMASGVLLHNSVYVLHRRPASIVSAHTVAVLCTCAAQQPSDVLLHNIPVLTWLCQLYIEPYGKSRQMNIPKFPQQSETTIASIAGRSP